MSNSVDPDETAHCLIWIYVVCKSLLLSPMAVKELNEVINGKAYQIYEELHILEKKKEYNWEWLSSNNNTTLQNTNLYFSINLQGHLGQNNDRHLNEEVQKQIKSYSFKPQIWYVVFFSETSDNKHTAQNSN